MVMNFNNPRRLDIYNFIIIVPRELGEALHSLYARGALHGVQDMTDAKEVASLVSTLLGVGVNIVSVYPRNRNGHK